MDTLHTVWHTVTTRPGITLFELYDECGADGALVAIAMLLRAGYIANRDGYYPVVPFVAVRRVWQVC